MKKFSNTFRNLREKYGLTQEEVATLLQVSLRTIQNYETEDFIIREKKQGMVLKELERLIPEYKKFNVNQSNIQNNYAHEPKEPYGESIEALKIKLQSCENENKALRDQVATLKELIALLKKES